MRRLLTALLAVALSSVAFADQFQWTWPGGTWQGDGGFIFLADGGSGVAGADGGGMAVPVARCSPLTTSCPVGQTMQTVMTCCGGTDGGHTGSANFTFAVEGSVDPIASTQGGIWVGLNSPDGGPATVTVSAVNGACASAAILVPMLMPENTVKATQLGSDAGICFGYGSTW